MKFPHLMALAAVLFTTFGVSAQTSDKCPIVSVEAPAKVDVGKSVILVAKLNVIVPTAKPEFEWTINTGTIIAGQGTSSITVDTAGLGGQRIDATVSVSGVSTICSTSATQSVEVLQRLLEGLAFDQFGDINFEDEKARLDNFAIQLANYKVAAGSIIIFAGRKTYQGEAAERLKQAKDYLVKVRNIDADQVTIVDGGYREDFQVYFYVIPPGATPPSLESDVSPTEIELTKPHTKIQAKKRS